MCRVCFEKLPDDMKGQLRFRGGHHHVNKHTYRLIQKAAVNYIRERTA